MPSSDASMASSLTSNHTPTPSTSPKEGEHDFQLEDLLNNTEEKCHFHSGIIRQPLKPVHQALHVDNVGAVHLMSSLLMNGDTLTPEDWLKCGYVIDIPLSQEGSWLRIAVPDHKKKEFVIHWAFVPFGSVLIRSMATFHGGHYGSPGNCRFHATFTMGSASVDNHQLAYLHGFGHGDADGAFKDWKLKWSDSIPEHCQHAAGYENILWSDSQRQGDNYFQKYFFPLYSGKFFANMLKNLSPYNDGLKITTQTKGKKVKLGSDPNPKRTKKRKGDSRWTPMRKQMRVLPQPLLQEVLQVLLLEPLETQLPRLFLWLLLFQLLFQLRWQGRLQPPTLWHQHQVINHLWQARQEQWMWMPAVWLLLGTLHWQST
jgi:hypothetical protein